MGLKLSNMLYSSYVVVIDAKVNNFIDALVVETMELL